MVERGEGRPFSDVTSEQKTAPDFAAGESTDGVGEPESVASPDASVAEIPTAPSASPETELTKSVPAEPSGFVKIPVGDALDIQGRMDQIFKDESQQDLQDD